MAKVFGNYASITRGVSQQAPADRLEGQHGEQVNMLSDPVRGLVRRNGMVIEDQLLQAISGPTGDAAEDSFSFRTYSYTDDSKDYDVLYRSRTKVGASPNHLTGLLVFDKTPITGEGWLDVVTDPDDAVMNSYLNGGFSAVASIGSYVLLAGHTVLPAQTTASQMTGQAWSNQGVVWVRGGAYARTYTVRAVRASDNTAFTATYTTMPAAYPGTLDTSGISYSDPDYQKQVNDLTYAYNAAVNQHIADASEDIVPSNIAQGLVDALTTAGFAGGWVVSGSHFGNDNIAYLEVDDGGDGSLMVALLSNTSAADEVTDQHWIGKVVKVTPRTADEGTFYLKAYARDGSAVATGLRPVIWREAAGATQTPTAMFAIGLAHEGSFYVASNPSTLADLILAETGDTVDVPPLVPSTVGDGDTAAAPHFVGRKITAMGLFQDRLLVVSGSTINASRPGDYFNFYRSSMLTLADDDPWEVYPLGAESDTIRQLNTLDRNLVLYGDDAHYMMNGRVAQTPSTAAVAAQYVIAETSYARPASTGQYLFCLKEDTQLGAVSMLQTRVGDFQDSPAMVEVSQQLRDYINGTPAEVVALQSPNIVFVRTEPFLKSQGGFPRARPWGLYVYQYMDNGRSERVHDSWSAWEWSSTLGTPIGVSSTGTGDGLMVYTLAWGRNETSSPTRGLLAMSVSARPDPTGLPYLDGMRRAELAEADGLLTPGATSATQAVTFTSPGGAHSYSALPGTTDADRFAGLEHPHYTMGDGPPEDVDEFRWTGVNGHYSDYVDEYPTAYRDDLWTGVAFPAFVDPTSPFVRDHKGKAKVSGRLTLMRLKATLIRSAGFRATLIDKVGTKTATHFSGAFERIRYDVPVWVGRDVRHVQVRLGAEDWMPLTINALGWEGQWFEQQKG